MGRSTVWRSVVLLACALFASQTFAQVCPPGGVSVQKYLNDSSLTVGQALVPLLGTAPFNGTVFVPTNAALNATLSLILELATNLTGTPVTSLPAGVTVADVFSNPAFQDVLKLHILPNIALDPTQLVAANFTARNFRIEDLPSLLSTQATPNFCPNGTTASAVLGASVNGTSGSAITGAAVIAPGNMANVINATVADICPGVVHIIDGILLPCGLADSVVPAFARSLAPMAASPAMMRSPSPRMTGNGTNTTSPPSSSAAAALFGGAVSSVWSASVLLVLAGALL